MQNPLKLALLMRQTVRTRPEKCRWRRIFTRNECEHRLRSKCSSANRWKWWQRMYSPSLFTLTRMS